jgi:hypothetical protein
MFFSDFSEILTTQIQIFFQIILHMSYPIKCPKCKQTKYFDKSDLINIKTNVEEISFLQNSRLKNKKMKKSTSNIEDQKFNENLKVKYKTGVICPDCDEKIIVCDDFNEGHLPDDVWERPNPYIQDDDETEGQFADHFYSNDSFEDNDDFS